jgi:hypothetical protein
VAAAPCLCAGGCTPADSRLQPYASIHPGASMFIGDNRLIAEAAASLGLNTSCRHDEAKALGGTRLTY